MDKYSDCDLCLRPLNGADTCAFCDDDKNYIIVRVFMKTPNRSLRASGLSLREALEWCNNPQTSSATATGAAAKRYTERVGPWWDGYDRKVTK